MLVHCKCQTNVSFSMFITVAVIQSYYIFFLKIEIVHYLHQSHCKSLLECKVLRPMGAMELFSLGEPRNLPLNKFSKRFWSPWNLRPTSVYKVWMKFLPWRPRPAAWISSGTFHCLETQDSRYDCSRHRGAWIRIVSTKSL